MSCDRLLNHRKIWRRKPVLEYIYSQWFSDLLDTIRPKAKVLEIGAGPGYFSTYARQHRGDVKWIAADIIPALWNNLTADALSLPLKDSCLDAIIGVDLLHHLSRPAEFFADAARVLRRGGSMAFIEPWITIFSYAIYSFFHHERCSLSVNPLTPVVDISTDAKDPFDGNSALVWRIVHETSDKAWHKMGFAAPQVKRLNSFAYLLSLGFHQHNLLPVCIAPTLIWIDRHTSIISPLFGMRALVSWKRLDGQEK